MVVTIFTAVIVMGMAARAIAGTAVVQAGDREYAARSQDVVETSAVTLDYRTEDTPEISEEPAPEATYESRIASRDLGAEDAEILLKIAMAEAEGEGVKGKALVMLTVLNRVWDEQFPDTIEEVVFAKNQFSVTAAGGRYYTTEPDEECYEALELVSAGWDESQGALYFESCKGDSWHSRNLEFLFQEGNHKFYK